MKKGIVFFAENWKQTNNNTKTVQLTKPEKQLKNSQNCNLN